MSHDALMDDSVPIIYMETSHIKIVLIRGNVTVLSGLVGRVVLDKFLYFMGLFGQLAL